MKTINHTRHSWNEIIFEKRNKLYGAYDLRETYDDRIVRSMILSFAFVTSLIAIPLLISHYFTKTMDAISTHDIIFTPTKVDTQIKTYVEPQPKKQQPPQRRSESAAPIANNSPVDTNNVPEPIAGLPSVNTNLVGTEVPAPETEVGSVSNTNINVEVDHSKAYDPWQVDKMPEYPGGTEAFYSFLTNHVRYPALARDQEKEGTVYVSFVIDASGIVTRVKLIRGAGYGFDEEAMDVISRMPKWKPGMAHGEPVCTAMKLPVNFKLVK